MFTGVSEPKSWDGQEFIDQLKSVKANIMTRSLLIQPMRVFHHFHYGISTQTIPKILHIWNTHKYGCCVLHICLCMRSSKPPLRLNILELILEKCNFWFWFFDKFCRGNVLRPGESLQWKRKDVAWRKAGPCEGSHSPRRKIGQGHLQR